MSVLHLATDHNAREAVEVLLDNECNFEGPRKQSTTVLHCTASYNQVHLMKLFLDLSKEKQLLFRFDIDVRNDVGKIPLMDAAERDHVEVAETLQYFTTVQITKLQTTTAGLRYTTVHGALTKRSCE